MVINNSEDTILQKKIIYSLSGNDTNPSIDCWDKEIRNIDKEKLPSIFYIGGPKSASITLVNGFSEHKTAHWHDVHHFKRFHPSIAHIIHDYRSIYNLVKTTGLLSNIKPLVIESYREPINRGISLMFHQLVVNDMNCLKGFDVNASIEKSYEFLLDKINCFLDITFDNQPFSRKMFNVLSFDSNQGYLYQEHDWCKFLFLLYENIDQWETTIHNIGYFDYSTKHHNPTTNRPPHVPNLTTEKYNAIYYYFKQNFKPTGYMLKRLSNNKFFNTFYTNDQREKIINKYTS